MEWATHMHTIIHAITLERSACVRASAQEMVVYLIGKLLARVRQSKTHDEREEGTCAPYLSQLGVDSTMRLLKDTRY